MRRASLLASDPAIVFAVVLTSAAVLRVVGLGVPNGPHIFDESYYVNSGRLLIGHAAGAPYHGLPSGLDPNHEHPPLGKALIALSMLIFGDGPLGWRLPNVLMGLAAIALLWALVREAAGSAWLAVGAAALFAFDNLAFVSGRIGTLDMPLVAFLLLGAWLFFRRSTLLAGGACGLAALVKLSGLYGLGALLLTELGGAVLAAHGGRADWRRAALNCFYLLLGFAVVWLLLLWLLDLRLTSFKTPWDHLGWMLRYGFSLSSPRTSGGPQSQPWQWIVNQGQMSYYREPGVWFRGAMNPLIIGIAPLAAMYSAWRAFTRRDPLSIWVVAWIAANYGVLCLLAATSHRIMYIHYFLPALPAVAIAVAQLVGDRAIPGWVRAVYALAVGVGFVSTFPFGPFA